MSNRLKEIACWCATSAFIFIPATTNRAVPFSGTALFSSDHQQSKNSRATERVQSEGASVARLPSTVHFREVSGRGLLVSVWVNDAGPYTFALDTGAGATILSRRVAIEAGVSFQGRRPLRIGGISGAGTIGGQEASVRSLAAGDKYNLLPRGGLVIVTERLGPGIEGVLDPTEAFWPLGFEIDMSRGLLTAFDPRSMPLRRNQNLQPDETILPWLFDGQSRRPFVLLEGRVRTLLDTGSGFGLALTPEAAATLGVIRGRRGKRTADVRDLSGGSISTHRIASVTVRLGGLVLRGIPTDLVENAEAGSPVLLGRDALRPFRLTFDPLSRLIRIVPG